MMYSFFSAYITFCLLNYFITSSFHHVLFQSMRIYFVSDLFSCHVYLSFIDLRWFFIF